MKHNFVVKRNLAVWTLASAVLANAGAALAQTQPGTSADELVLDGDRIVRQLDAGQYDDVWRNMAPFVRSQEPQADFVRRTREAREAMGNVVQRGWVSINRVVIQNNTTVPNGLYANVDYLSSLASGRTVPEHLSFYLGSDGHWYLTGYAPRPALAAAPASGTTAK